MAEDRPCIRRCPTLKFRNAHAFTQKKDAETPGTTAEATPKSPFNPMIQVPWKKSAREREREQRALERADRRERERESERERASESERERESMRPRGVFHRRVCWQRVMHMPARVHACTFYIQIYLKTRILKHTFAVMCVCMYVCMYVCMFASIYIHADMPAY